MFKKLIIVIAVINCIYLSQESKSEEIKQQNLLGFESKSDLRVGPIGTFLYPLSVSNSNVSYSPSININLHGESFNFGSTGLNFTWISSNRNVTIVDSSKPTTLKFNDVSPSSGVNKINKNLLLLTLSSPINYNPGSFFEFGWLGGIFNQFIQTNGNIAGDSNSNLGLNLGAYSKLYYFYPFVPYIDGKILIGNMYDNGKTLQEAGLRNSIKGGYMGAIGMDFYITRRIILNIGYNIINPDFYTFSPTKALVNQPNSPKDDVNTSFDEQMHGLSGSIGFLF